VILEPVELTEGELALIDEVRAFLRVEMGKRSELPCLGIDSRSYSPTFTKLLARRGWVGMAVPSKYGGPGRTAVERYLVAEQLLAAGAPIGAHWVADRQTVHMLLAFGSEEQRLRLLPQIAAGECYFSVGLSEPNTGSELASVQTRAVPVSGGWRVSGTKIWTSGAQHTHFAMLLCRTAPISEGKHQGLSQFILPLDSGGVELRPILLMSGERHFNELVLDDVFISDDNLLGVAGEGWAQVTSELAYERAGADRMLTTFPLLEQFVREYPEGTFGDDANLIIGELLSRLWCLREMCLAVARAIDAKQVPKLEAAIVKDLGTHFEQDVVSAISTLLDEEIGYPAASAMRTLLLEATLIAPAYTIRGGTTEILRSVITREVIGS
jgi:alkylation response protein AidB-like acyl-CoA dehydrogenase